ncbi:helix-turn-helix protein [Haloactinopolyspora alba]|uniref:Helix-turn-helix protein n=1 Tax=Haloactinopolyspora alba TaxID=648780 RepID=A0A2P8DWB3_9ACTN|nr:helix-turn-helix domain-containing protein [Haloactinopolyspora alba]PSL01513.1 helix-turn-helix protein [Haloactinopolyspora alba]
MITFELGPYGLAHSRFALSRLVELNDALEVLTHPDRAPYARRWVQRTRRLVDRSSLAVLLALVEHESWYVPDFLVPLPDRYEPSFDDELAAVAAAPADRVRAQLELAFRIGEPPAEVLEVTGSAPGQDPRAPLPDAIAAVLDGGGAEALLACVINEVHRCWTVVLSDAWDAVRRVLDEDVRHHAVRASRTGLSGIVAGLHTSLEHDDDRVTLDHPYDMRLGCASGLILTPSVFLPRPAAWRGSSGHAMVGYPAHGRGRVWSEPVPLTEASGLVGARRTALLADLATARSTAELADRHGLSRATVSYHVRKLHEAGLLSRRRAGRAVLYERTGNAAAVLAGLGVPGSAD